MLALRFAVGDAVECYMDGCFHRGTVVALNLHRNDNLMPVCPLGAALLRYASANTVPSLGSYFTHSHTHRDGRLVGWRRHRTRSCSTRAASSGHHPILMASSAQGVPGYRHRRVAAARRERPIAAAAAAAAAAAVAGAMPGAGAAIGAGAASAVPAALAAETAAAAVTVTMRAVPAVTVIFGRKIGATSSSATTRATASASDRRSGRSGRRRHRRLWRRPCNRASLSSPLSKN